MRFRTLIPVTLTALAFAQSVAAAPFVEGTGKVDLAGADFGVSFDHLSADIPIRLYDWNYRQITEEELATQLEQDPLAAIEGEGVLSFGGTTIYGFVDLRAIAERFRGRRVEVRMWQRARGSEAEIALQWYSGPLEELFAGQRTGRLFLIASVPFQPTGRGTDDGWREWTSGPIDFDLGGEIPAQIIDLSDKHLRGLYSGVGDYDAEVRVALDALSVEDLGPAAVPRASCTLADEAQRCGAAGACYFGRCADAASVVGPRLENAAIRHDYLARRVFELSSFEGGRAPIAQMDRLRAAFEGLRGDVSALDYREAIVSAIAELGDGHSSAPVASYLSGFGTSVCLHHGAADLLPEGGEAPLVFEASRQTPIGAALRTGDALIAIDGLSVGEWSRRARRYLTYGGDPAAAQVVSAPELMTAAITTGATLTFARCNTSSTSSVACGPSELERVRVELAPEVAGLWSHQVPAWRYEHRTCDWRFRRPVEGPQVCDYAYAGSRDLEGARWLLINGVPSGYDADGRAWFQSVSAALEDGPPRVVLDQRLGQGGSIEAVDHLASYLVAEPDFDAMEMIPQLHAALTPALLDGMVSCSQGGSSALGSSGCGSFMLWRLGEASAAPSRGAASSAKLAVLIGSDVSGNDFVSKLLTYRRSALTRIFGAAPTHGAFGVIWQLPAYGGETLGGSFQVHDTRFLASPGDPNATFTTSSGVPPDEVVLQRQSDLRRNVDTLMARASAWIAE